WPDFVKEAEIKLPPHLEKLALKQPMEFDDFVEAPLGELHAAYTKAKVPQHRYLYPLISESKGMAAPMALQAGLSESISKLNIDISKLIDLISKTDGNTDFEELNCVGYDP